MIYNRLGQNDRAELLLREVIEKHPEVPGTAYSLGLLLAEMERYEEAIVFLEKATLQQPDNARVFLNYGQLLDFSGRQNEAQKALEHSLSLEPENAEIMIRLIEFYMKHNQFRDAMELTINYMRMFPGDESAAELLNYIDTNIQ